MGKNWRNNIGPGPLVAAAFIGPGTVTVCTVAGVNFGFDLLWALGLSILATIVLQEMAARIGLVTQKGLAEAIKSQIHPPVLKLSALVLVLLAIVLGNAAYEAGNISGGALGLEVFLSSPEFSIGQFKIKPLNVLIGLLAFVLLMTGSIKSIEKFMLALVILMSLAFLSTAILTRPHLGLLFKGLVPKIDTSNILTIVALIGTTVVPYNLFLHASLVGQKWAKTSDLKYVRKDTLVSVILGGLISMAIVITAAVGSAEEVNSAIDLAKGLELTLGGFAPYFLGIGLFAAGITSAITAPLAGALVVSGCFGLDTAIKSKAMRWAMGTILGLGLMFSSLGIKPVQLITFAQLANGILLPLISTFLLWTVNQKGLLGHFKNSWKLNILGLIIWLFTLLLGLKSILQIIN
ncbi:Nramp family divalent metal transporter [Pararhodonellum marinum]|uniref:Nramp family divalent metal transporter n=1 Tax=Pararhodonellum marinum TaxID=2755358 RepID=UPI00188FA99C|nr:Nramp family divalent metal transporter [Pararhodonellum marinum]